MKKFFAERVIQPLKSLSWWNQVFLICIPVSALLCWLLFALPILRAENVIVYGYQMFSRISIGGLWYDFNGYKEVMGCLFLTSIGIDSLVQHGRLAMFFQTLGSCTGLILFSLFPLLDVKSLNQNGIETEFLYGSVFPILMCFIMVVSCVVLSVTAIKKK